MTDLTPTPDSPVTPPTPVSLPHPVVLPQGDAVPLDDAGAKARQLLGMKGAKAGETSIWKIHLQLMKPITWIPLIWGVVCGAASSGNYTWTLENVLIAAACMLMSGPLLAGYTQTINDYYDRDLDAINEPYRPIPSGAIPLPRVIAQIWVLLLGGIGVAFALNLWAHHEFPGTHRPSPRRLLPVLYLFRPALEAEEKWLARQLCPGF